MKIEDQLWKDANISEEEFKNITDELLAITEEYQDNVSYAQFERSIRSLGYSISKAKIIIGLCAAKSMFSNVIESWENPPLEISSIIKQIDKEDYGN